jgi:hypothetical protein
MQHLQHMLNDLIELYMNLVRPVSLTRLTAAIVF